jgi:hypothetical protein
MTADNGRRFRRNSLLIAIGAFIVALILWNVPQLDFLMYPVRLFVTFIHETGHGVAAIISGGQFHQLVVSSDGSGVAATSGGWRWLILPAGYVGAALFGAALFYLANTVRDTRYVSAGVAVLCAVMALVYTDFLSTAWLVGLGFALIMGLLAWKGRREINLAVLNVLAVICALNAVVDLVGVINNSTMMAGNVRNDAAAFTDLYLPIFPPGIVAVCWAGIAIGLLVMAVWYSVGRRARRVVEEMG